MDEENTSNNILNDSEVGKENPKGKKIKKEKVVKKAVPALIQPLFQYFYQEVNYTLAAYVCKVMGALLVKKPEQML